MAIQNLPGATSIQIGSTVYYMDNGIPKTGKLKTTTSTVQPADNIYSSANVTVQCTLENDNRIWKLTDLYASANDLKTYMDGLITALSGNS